MNLNLIKWKKFKSEWLNLLAYCRSQEIILIIIEHDFKHNLADSDEIIIFQRGQISHWLDSRFNLATKLSRIENILVRGRLRLSHKQKRSLMIIPVYGLTSLGKKNSTSFRLV